MPDIDAAFTALKHQIGASMPMPNTDAIITRGRRRVAMRISVASIAVIAVLGGGVFALANTIDRPQPLPPASQPSPIVSPSASPTPRPLAIPPGFLLYEAEADRDPTALEYRSGEAGAWAPELCIGNNVSMLTSAARHRLAFSDRTRAVSYEDLSVLGSPQTARTALEAVRTELRRCQSTREAGFDTTLTTEPITLGDEALLIKAATKPTKAAGPVTLRWSLFVRRGTAIVEYSGTDRAQVHRDATTMTAKLCELEGAC